MSDRSRPLSVRSVVRKAALLPLVLGGAMAFWTMALGLGGLSLVAVTALSQDVETYPLGTQEFIPPTAVEPMPGHFEPITVQIQESSEPEDVNDNAGATAFQVAD